MADPKEHSTPPRQEWQTVLISALFATLGRKVLITAMFLGVVAGWGVLLVWGYTSLSGSAHSGQQKQLTVKTEILEDYERWFKERRERLAELERELVKSRSLLHASRIEEETLNSQIQELRGEKHNLETVVRQAEEKAKAVQHLESSIRQLQTKKHALEIEAADAKATAKVARREADRNEKLVDELLKQRDAARREIKIAEEQIDTLAEARTWSRHWTAAALDEIARQLQSVANETPQQAEQLQRVRTLLAELERALGAYAFTEVRLRKPKETSESGK